MLERELIQASGLFDETWYCQQYPDVKLSGLDPLSHLLRLGLMLQRDPGPGFDTRWYLEANPDVAQDGMPPLLHYLQYGQFEGRSPCPLAVAQSAHARAVDVVVPVYNAREHALACLASLHAARDGCQLRVVVVNDGSDAATSAALSEFCSCHEGFELIENPRNLGYTAAMNRGLGACRAPWVVMLNSDTLVTPGWLQGLLRCLASDPKLVMVGPLSNAASWQSVPRLHDERGEFAVNRLPPGLDVAAMAQQVAACAARSYPRVPVLNGFCILLRRSLLQQIGMLDEERFPQGYGEENDLCLRAGAAGHAMAVADDVYVHHVKSASFGHARRRELSARAAGILAAKHGPEKVEALTRAMQSHAGLARVRQSVQEAVQEALSRPAASGQRDLFATSILYLLRAPGGGGGAHSVMQEASELHRMGVSVTVAVEASQLESYRRLYADLPGLAAWLRGWDDASVLREAGNYDVGVATISTSVPLLQSACAAHPRLLPAYYVQDYEPLFYSEGTPTRAQALASYEQVPGALLFAKTGWVCSQVEGAHGVRVAKVLPGIDLDLYRPRPRPAGARPLVLTAMIRPQTPRRGAARSMRVLAQLARRLPDLEIRLFGCDGDDAQFRALPQDFRFHNAGVLRRAEVAELLAQSDCFIDLSDYQAFGRTALEAMACGCVAVLPRAGGGDEFALDGVNALVVDSSDEAHCVHGIAALLEDRSRLERLRRAGLQSATGYGLRAAALSILRVLGEAVERRSLAPQLRQAAALPSPKQSMPQTAAQITRQVSGQVSGEIPEHVPEQASKALSPATTSMPTSSPASRPMSGSGKLPITVLVLTWDVGHNPLGRSYMLAEVLQRVARKVVLAGFGFARYGEQVWEPVREGGLPVIRIPGGDMPDFLRQVERIAERVRPDLVVACKPRLPSLQLAAAIKARWGCPLVLDIDDHELSFFKNDSALALPELAALPREHPVAPEPFEEIWTRAAHGLLDFADATLVSNIALQKRFGGTLLPHVRDERSFDPALHSRARSRLRYGVAQEDKVVLFFGTPRAHKGIDTLARTVARLPGRNWRLVVVGSSTDRSVTQRLQSLAAGRLTLLPNQPFADIPQVLAMADVVCLPQDDKHPVSQYQLPAKAIDAIGMGVPLLVTRTPPLMQLVADGVATAVDEDSMDQAILAAVEQGASRRQTMRATFLARYSHAAAGAVLKPLLQQLLQSQNRRSVQALTQLRAQQERLLGPAPRAALGRGRDVLLFWKQNDSGLYGRRMDMVAQYLASRPDVRRVLVIDAPISEHDLLRLRDSGEPTSQDRLIYRRTYEKHFGLRDAGKLFHHVYIYQPGVWNTGGVSGASDGKPALAQGWIGWLTELFQREAVDARQALYWIYPRNFHLPAVLEHFQPQQVVADVVDDHRAWPGVTPAERERLDRNYRALLSRAGLAMVNCEAMLQAMQPFHARLQLVPNGCAAAPATVVEPTGNAHFMRLAGHAGRVIGYVGNLESKLDLALLEKIAASFPQDLLVLLGSTHANPAARELARLPNVCMPGAVSFDELPAWLARFDAGVIPHLDTALTRSMNPLKLYVYLAHRLPVVSTEVAHIDLASGGVRMASSHESFLEQLRQALDGGKLRGRRIETWLRRNGWQARLAPHVDAILKPAKRQQDDRLPA